MVAKICEKSYDYIVSKVKTARFESNFKRKNLNYTWKKYAGITIVLKDLSKANFLANTLFPEIRQKITGKEYCTKIETDFLNKKYTIYFFILGGQTKVFQRKFVEQAKKLSKKFIHVKKRPKSAE